MRHLICAVACLATIIAAPASAKMVDAPQGKVLDTSLGCEILICAASKNPSWRSEPFCVQVMGDLLDAMSEPGFSWPVCEHAKAGAPRHQIYDKCPGGSRIGHGASGHDGSRGAPDVCIQTVNVCKQRADHKRNRSADGNDCMRKIVTPRPLRADPWLFEIPDDGRGKRRIWFNLRREPASAGP